MAYFITGALVFAAGAVFGSGISRASLKSLLEVTEEDE